MERKRFRSFKDFYPYYLSEHQNKKSRRLHFFGTGFSVATLLSSLLLKRGDILLLMPVFGYGMAWIGHYFFEKNRPATFTHPVYSLMGDIRMFLDILRKRLAF